MKDRMEDVLCVKGADYQLRPYKAQRGTFLIERRGNKHRAAVVAGISRSAAEHYVKTLPYLLDLRSK